MTYLAYMRRNKKTKRKIRTTTCTRKIDIDTR